jgi:hypothetical protein
MVTLWILIIGFKNAGGIMTPYAGPPTMQALATYRTDHECDVASKGIHEELQAGGVSVHVICLPTGMSDPLSAVRRP